MGADDISKLDVLYVLRRCPVVRAEPGIRDETWNVRGKDTDERTLEIVVVVNEDNLTIKVVTAWKRN
jgi:hypothetical protein